MNNHPLRANLHNRTTGWRQAAVHIEGRWQVARPAFQSTRTKGAWKGLELLFRDHWLGGEGWHWQQQGMLCLAALAG